MLDSEPVDLKRPAGERQEARPRERVMKKAGKYAVLIGLGLGLAAIVATVALRDPPATNQASRRNRGGDGPVPISAVAASKADVPVYIEGVGTAAAYRTVTVRPQVDGKLDKVLFKEGQDVKQGDVLATIEPIAYKARLDQVTAKKAQTESQLENAKTDLDRMNRMTKEFVVQKTLDTQKATVAQLTAQLRSDQAAIEDAKNNLDYTTIRAPMDGRAGIRLVDEGNIVQASSTNAIVVLTQVRPITVLFSLPQQNLRAVNQGLAKGVLRVEVMEADNTTVIDSGTLQVVDNQVDQTTGTVKLKAEFPNEKLQIWPGQFVNVRLLIETLPGVVTAPTAAVQRGPRGTFVYVVKPDSSVEMRLVSIGLTDERKTVILAGLEENERVATNGFQRLSDKAKVVVTTDTPPSEKPLESRQRRRQETSEKKPPDAADKPVAPKTETTNEAEKQGERQRRGERRNRPQNAQPTQ